MTTPTGRYIVPEFRERSAKSLVDEIERGYRELGLTFFYLWGDTVTLNVKSFSAFCEELISRNLPVQWFGNARADNLTDPAFVDAVHPFGGEAGHDGMLGRARFHDERQKVAVR